MTFQISYKSSLDGKEMLMFDIEYWLTQIDLDEVKWFSDISCLPIVSGLTYFLKDKLSEGEKSTFSYQDFIKDATEIQEIRGFLFEKNGNAPKQREIASEFHYRTFYDKIYDLFSDFCQKYGLSLSID